MRELRLRDAFFFKRQELSTFLSPQAGKSIRALSCTHKTRMDCGIRPSRRSDRLPTNASKSCAGNNRSAGHDPIKRQRSPTRPSELGSISVESTTLQAALQYQMRPHMTRNPHSDHLDELATQRGLGVDQVQFELEATMTEVTRHPTTEPTTRPSRAGGEGRRHGVISQTMTTSFDDELGC
jgi:hypothetical protein